MLPTETLDEKKSAAAEAETSQSMPYTIRCYVDVAVSLGMRRTVLSGERLLAAQALRLLMRLDAEFREARADWNQDRFRRIMKARPKAVLRVFRRWSQLDPQPSILLGNLRRRCHANLAGGYLFRARE